MKKFLALSAALVLLTSSSAFAVISGSAHDFVNGPGVKFGTDICAPCHTPHNSYAPAAGGPLWAHTASTATWTQYSSTNSATYNMTNNAIDSISLACLSCHDGTVALDSYIGAGTAAAGSLPAGSSNLGTDLSNDHPVSFTYLDTADAQGGLYTLAQAKTNIAGALVFYGAGADQVECATCHDVHNAVGITGLLRSTNAASALCLACHNK